MKRKRNRLPRVSPVALGYLIGPLALVVILLLMHFGVVVRQPIWLWIAVFVIVPATSLMVDHLVRKRCTTTTLNIRVAQNVGAVTVVIYLSGWGPVLVLAFAFVALENIALDGARLWRATALWSMLGIAAGQTAIWVGWAPSVLSISHANAVAFMGAFVLFFVIRMAGATMEQKELAESLVSRSEDRFRSLIQNSSDVTMVVRDGILTYVSPSVTAMLGFEPNELIGRPAAEIIHVEDRARVGARIRSDSSTSSDGVAVQFRMEAKTGAFRLVEAVVADQLNRPSVGGLVANIRDITERTKAAQELEETQESFRVLFEQHPHPMWVYDLETLRFLEVNLCATEHYGYTREEFLSMTIADIRPEEDARRLRKYLRVERPALNYAGTWRHRTRSGEIIDVDVTTHTLDFRGRPGGLVIAQDITERLRLERELRDHALHDALTGLPNRALLLDRIERVNTLATQSRSGVMVLRLHLDNFELLMETYGHDVGDAVICRVGERLLASVPETDTVGRTAEHEFVILDVPGALEVDPDAMAERALNLVRSTPFRVDGHEFNLTASAGIVAGRAHEGAELIEKAGTALNLAKAEGGNHYVVFAHEMQTAVDERIQLTMALRDAVGAEQFENFYQPVLRLKDLSVVGVEALVRWHHPTLGLVSPERFISLAEETGMIRDIGASVINQACEHATVWHRKNKKLTVAVNVSVFQLRSDEFISDVRDALERTGLDPGTLVLEVTESILINNPDTALRRLKALKELGVRLAIDDFGTGYSSLSYLSHFPFDILKIDQSFVASMAESPEAMTMVRTIIDLGRRLKLEVIAEGVEHEQQLELLRRLHCHYVQGYHYSRPIDAEAMTWLLTEWSGIKTALPGSLAARSRRKALHTSTVVTPDYETRISQPGPRGVDQSSLSGGATDQVAT